MKSPAIVICCILIYSFNEVSAQSEITQKIDGLTASWDEEALVLTKFEGMRDVCRNRTHRVKIIDLIKEIHHYDSVLYTTVQNKYDADKDAEAKETLKDIKKLENDYTTSSFLHFIHTECSTFNAIEKNYAKAGGKPYEKEKAKMEKELSKYVDEVTNQIDIIDEHIHHLSDIE